MTAATFPARVSIRVYWKDRMISLGYPLPEIDPERVADVILPTVLSEMVLEICDAFDREVKRGR